ncbi:hypothetical protein FHY20_000625 [Xanthomonas campestris]|nr:hypothetical protein [Xanthomonas cannabis]
MAAQGWHEWRHGSGRGQWPSMIPLWLPSPPRPARRCTTYSGTPALKKSADGLIPQAIGRGAAWTTMEHDPNDR